MFQHPLRPSWKILERTGFQKAVGTVLKQSISHLRMNVFSSKTFSPENNRQSLFLQKHSHLVHLWTLSCIQGWHFHLFSTSKCLKHNHNPILPIFIIIVVIKFEYFRIWPLWIKIALIIIQFPHQMIKWWSSSCSYLKGEYIRICSLLEQNERRLWLFRPARKEEGRQLSKDLME